ncbi:MAG: outer membrane beta-barrel protein [Pseudomonadota bacterium]
MRTYDANRRYGAETVLERDRSYVKPEGIRAGRFNFFPSAGVTTLYDDNIFAAPEDTVSDLRTELDAGLEINSNFSRHQLNFGFGGRFVEFLDNPDQNYVAGAAAMKGALHFDHAHTLAVSLTSDLGYEERGSQTVPIAAAEPVPVWSNEATIGFTRDVGKLYGTISGKFVHRNYYDVDALDGSNLDQDLRESTQYSTQLKAGYRFSPGFEAVGKIRYVRQDSIDNANPFIGSDGYEALAGVSFETSPLLRWQLLAGYGIRNYDHPELENFGTSLLEGHVEWLPTERMTITGVLSRKVETLDTADTGGRVETGLTARIDYDIANDLVLSVGGGISNSDFINDNRDDWTYTGNINLEYFLNKNWSFTINYDHEFRDSTQAAFDYTRHRIGVGAKLKF